MRASYSPVEFSGLVGAAFSPRSWVCAPPAQACDTSRSGYEEGSAGLPICGDLFPGQTRQMQPKISQSVPGSRS